MVICGHAQEQRKTETPAMQVPSCRETSLCPAVMLQLSNAANNCPVAVRECNFLTPLWFLLMIYFPVTNSLWAKFQSGLVFLNTRRLQCALWRKYMCETSFVRVWVPGLLPLSSTLINQHVLNKVSLIRNIYQIKVLYWSVDKKCD